MNEFGVQSHYTAGGLLYISEWGPLRYAANTAFICSILADLGISPNENRFTFKIVCLHTITKLILFLET